jgi:protein-disulfide isomerase
MGQRLTCILLTLALAACARSEAPTVSPVGLGGGGTPPPVATAPPAAKPAATPRPKPAIKPRPKAAQSTARAPAAASKTLAQMKALERTPGASPPPPTVEVAAGPKHPSLEGTPGPSPAFGPDTAAVKVFIYSDFQCPVCRRVVEPIKAAARELGDSVQLVFKHNALTMHPRAEAAARASVAAFRQGKFWEFHDLLFQDQRSLGDQDFLTHARTLGLDIARFQRDIADPTVTEQIAYERATATAMQARGTPAFFINGKKQVGWGSYGSFKSMITRAVKGAELLSRQGTAPAEIAKKATRESGEDGAKLADLLWGPE